MANALAIVNQSSIVDHFWAHTSFGCGVAPQKQFTPVLENHERQFLSRPLALKTRVLRQSFGLFFRFLRLSAHRDLSQLGLDVLFLQGRYADVLNVLLVGQEGRLEDVLEAESRPLQVEGESGDALDLLPVAVLHGLVAHQLQQGTDVVEVVDGLLEGVEGRPLLEGLGQLPAPVLELQQLVVDVLDVDLGPRDVVVVVDAGI